MNLIKCKAWNTKINKMFSAAELGQDQLTLSPDGRGFVNVCSTDTRLSEYYPHMIPLQFIGMNDKNSIEMYDGDIIYNPEMFGFHTFWNDCEDNFPCYRVIQSDDKELQFKLCYIEENIRNRGTSGYCLCKGNEIKFEIVGTIHDKEFLHKLLKS